MVVSTVLHSHDTFPLTMQVHMQPAEGGSDTVKGEYRLNTLVVGSGWAPWSHAFPCPSIQAIETALGHQCWIPLGVQSQSVRPETGELRLQQSASAIVGEEEDAILVKIPPGAIRPSESVEIRSAIIPNGPFILPKGYKLGSMVVYVYYDSQCVFRSLQLLLPHWYGGEDPIGDGLAFAMAQHKLKEGESAYCFELLKEGRRFSNHCGELEIKGHCSLFAAVFKEGALSRYQAIFLQKEKGNETTSDVAVTFASPLWCDVSIYTCS